MESNLVLVIVIIVIVLVVAIALPLLLRSSKKDATESKLCPKCGTQHEAFVSLCDCGWDFKAGIMTKQTEQGSTNTPSDIDSGSYERYPFLCFIISALRMLAFIEGGIFVILFIIESGPSDFQVFPFFPLVISRALTIILGTNCVISSLVAASLIQVFIDIEYNTRKKRISP